MQIMKMIKFNHSFKAISTTNEEYMWAKFDNVNIMEQRIAIRDHLWPFKLSTVIRIAYSFED